MWWLRWMLVVLLAFDQASAPLHRHHHVNAIDAVVSVGTAHDDLRAGVNAHDDGRELHFTHVVSAARAEALEPAWFTDEPAGGMAEPGPWPSALLGTPIEVGHAAERALATHHPARPVPLSRPPEGRAPPLRA